MSAAVLERICSEQTGPRIHPCQSVASLETHLHTSLASHSGCLSSAASDLDLLETRVKANANFISDSIPFGEGVFGPKPGQDRLGYSVPDEFLAPRQLELWTLQKDATFIENGFELLSITDALAAEGLTEATFDASLAEHRKVVGKLLMAAAEARFPGKLAVHLADTSRVSGSAVYGEATARNTAASSKLRAAQHIFHMDKFLPGIAKLYGESSARAGAEKIVDAYWSMWEPDFSKHGVTREEVVKHCCNADPGMLNLWVSLTPGGVVQSPLAVADMRNILLDDSDLDCVSTHAIIFPGLEDTITVLRPRATEGAKIMFRPKMRFGEVIMFSTTHTPHSAVHLNGQPDVGRCSAEIRLLLVDRKIPAEAEPMACDA